MKVHIPKDWLLSRDHLEEGLAIGAGSLRRFAQPEAVPSPVTEDITLIEQRLSFGRFISLMRRKHGWTTQQLAENAEVDAGELLVIENDPRHEAELSTVHGLSKLLKVPAKRLIKMAGLATERSEKLAQASLRFAASAESVAPLTGDEEEALQTYLKVVLDETDKK
jgi:transcriptional regulator with XRE-family HTH domain